MPKNFVALSKCENNFIKLRIISAQDPDVLDGYRRAWPEYFTDKTTESVVPLSKVIEIIERKGWGTGCVECGIPTIDVRLPWDIGYRERGIPSTRGLLFQLGDFSEVHNGTVVRLYHTRWVILYFVGPPGGRLSLAPLECIDLES